MTRLQFISIVTLLLLLVAAFVRDVQRVQAQSGAPLFGTSSAMGGSLLIAGGCSFTTMSVPGARVGQVADANPTSYPGDGAYWFAFVSGADQVTVKVCGVLTITPASTTYAVRVFP